LFVFAHLGACIVAVYGDSPEGNFGEQLGVPSPQLELSSEVLLDLPEIVPVTVMAPETIVKLAVNVRVATLMLHRGVRVHMADPPHNRSFAR
jgi:hypothetical protein